MLSFHHGRRRRAAVAGVFWCSLLAEVTLAQSVIDPGSLEFLPSRDQDSIGVDGSPLVTHYELQLYMAGASHPFHAESLGKPVPAADGLVRVRPPSFSVRPTPGVPLEARVSAVGPGGARASETSNSFMFTFSPPAPAAAAGDAAVVGSLENRQQAGKTPQAAEGWSLGGNAPEGGREAEAPGVEPFGDDVRLPDDAIETIVPEAAHTGDVRIDALLSGYQWPRSAITYSFYRDSVFGGTYFGTETGVREVSEKVKQNTRSVMAWYGTIIGVPIVEVEESATTVGVIRIMVSDFSGYAYTYYPTSASLASVAGDIHLSSQYDRSGDANGFQEPAGSHGYLALVHEIGHALGLKHPHTGSPVLPAADDNNTQTVMSYTFLGRSPATPMGYDVLALQYLYGARASRTEPDRYVFTRATVDQYRVGGVVWVTPSGETQQVLWDGGGYNVLDVSAAGGSGSGYRIDSRPLGWVTTGAAYQGTYMTAGTQVGPGVRIHEVITSSSADTVYLNAEANVVRGYGPGQSSGTDVIIGGTSADTVDLSGYAASQVTQTVSGTHLVLGLGGDGSLTLQDYYAGFQPVLAFGSTPPTGGGAGVSNQAPVAVVGATPAGGVAPLPVTFSAAGSSDPDGRVVGYAWTFGDGTSGTGVTPSHTYGAAGRYVVTVTVTDDRGATAAASVTVGVTAPPVSPPVSTAKNRPPYASLEATPASGSAPLTVQFSGAGSSDPDGSVATYEWGLGTGATGTGATLAYTYTTPGNYVATVTVTDNRGARNTAAVWITVTAGPGSGSNRPPVAVVAATPVSGAAPLPVSFTAAGSSDPDGSLVGYGWTFGDGATGSGVAAVHTYAIPGSYVATVTVTDHRGATATASTTITVSGGPTNRPPVAVVAATPTSGPAPLTVQFDGAGSSDPEDPVVGHAWTYGDGTTGTGATSTHTYASSGTFAATLTVTDARGLTHSASTPIIVTPASTAASATLSVASIGLGFINDGTKWVGRAVVRIVDERGAPVPQAVVSARWTGMIPSAFLYAMTDAAGHATFLSRGLWQSGTVGFTVVGVSKGDLTYESFRNVVSTTSAVFQTP